MTSRQAALGMAPGVARLYASALRGCGRQQEAIPVVQVCKHHNIKMSKHLTWGGVGGAFTFCMPLFGLEQLRGREGKRGRGNKSSLPVVKVWHLLIHGPHGPTIFYVGRGLRARQLLAVVSSQ